MRRPLLDESVPAGLSRLLSDFDVKTVPEMGWAGISNGRLLDEAERAGFDVVVTADQNLRWQQRLANRKIGVNALSTNRWDVIRANAEQIAEACQAVRDGSHIELRFARGRVRRPKGPSL
jgi:hypothetical protein